MKMLLIHPYIYIYIYIYIKQWYEWNSGDVSNIICISERIIIILSCHQHGYPWPFLATSPYRSSLLAGPQGYIPYPHRADVSRFELVTLLLLGHVKGSIGVHHLWARPYFSSSESCMTQPRIELRYAQTPLEFWNTNGSPNLGQTTRPNSSQ